MVQEKNKEFVQVNNKEFVQEKNKETIKKCISYFNNKSYTYQNYKSLFDIYTTRFTSFTYLQNIRTKDKYNIEGALYGTTLSLPHIVFPEKYVFVLDMNNTINKIMGIGIIKNKLSNEPKIKIYDNPAFNNFIYKSKYYIPLIDIHNHNEYYDYIQKNWQNFICDEFETNLFYGKAHLKRGGSYTRFPLKKTKKIHFEFLVKLFICLNPNNFNSKILQKI